MMEDRNIRIEYKIFRDRSQLSLDEQKLIEMAENSMLQAYSPYSNLKVGSAILLSNGEIITGSNQESPIFPLGLCAERVALFTYGHRNINSPIKALAVTSDEIKGRLHPLFPCGACRQSILDFEIRQQQDIELIIFNSDQILYFDSVKALLPFAIDDKFLS